MYEKCDLVTYQANAAIPKDSIGKAIKIVRSGTEGRAALVTAVTDAVVGILAQDGPFVAGESVPVALLRGVVPVRTTTQVTAASVAAVQADGRFAPQGGFNGIPNNAMGAGVFAAYGAAAGIVPMIAFPTFKS